MKEDKFAGEIMSDEELDAVVGGSGSIAFNDLPDNIKEAIKKIKEDQNRIPSR